MLKTRLLSACCYYPDGSLKGEARIEKNREVMLDVLEAAKSFSPDFVVFPELFLQVGAAEMKDALIYAETIPGPTSEMISAKAKEMGCHVWLPTFEKKGDLTCNSVALIGRDGAVMGVYRKYHATGYEILDGVQPGDDVPVWETDCGRVGCCVCFDLKFPIVGLELSRRKAQIVFWPTMFAGGRRMQSWAMDYGFYFVKCQSSAGAILDPDGNTVATYGLGVKLPDSGATVHWSFAEVNADVKAYHCDYNSAKIPDIIAKYGAGVAIGMHDPEGTFTLTCNLPDKRAEDIEKEFELTDLRDYFEEATRIRESRLK